MKPKKLRIGLLVTALIGVSAGAGFWWRMHMRQATSQAAGRYADPAACAECHPDVAVS